MTRPTLVFLHALGGSARAWDAVIAALPDMDGIALDLPGFGARATEGYADVATTIDHVANEIRTRGLARCVLVGHSMGGKIATLIATRAQAADAALAGIAGIVLVAASPPAPEPMAEDRRAEMIGWVADDAISAADGRTFVAANIAHPLPPARDAQAIADVRRSSPDAWRGWLENGSHEDWRDRAGQIALPALILAGAEDGDLGEDAQRRLNLPHYPNGRIAVIADAAHLIPFEQPDSLAEAIRRHVTAAIG